MLREPALVDRALRGPHVAAAAVVREAGLDAAAVAPRRPTADDPSGFRLIRLARGPHVEADGEVREAGLDAAADALRRPAAGDPGGFRLIRLGRGPHVSR